MSLNISYIEKSVTFEMRTSYLARQIRQDLGSFLRKRRYLDKWTMGRSLQNMGYPPRLAGELVDYIRTSAENAFERGVFVVSSRVVGMDACDFDCPQHLISYLLAKEGEYFDAQRWYTLKTFEDHLRSENYNHTIVYEIAPIVLRHARAAFTRGIKGAANKLIKVG